MPRKDSLGPPGSRPSGEGDNREGGPGQGQSLDTESFDSRVKGTAVKATPRAHLARAGLEEGEPVAGGEPGTRWRQIGPVFTAQPRCCNRKRAGEGGGSSGGNNLSGARGAAGEEASSAALQGQARCVDGIPGAKAASGLRLPTPSRGPVNSVPLSSPTAEPAGQPSPLLALSLGLPFPVGCPPDCRAYLLPSAQ